MAMHFGAAVGAAGILAAAAVARAEVAPVPTADPAMTAAIAKARATLPGFFERLARPQPGDKSFAVKILYATPVNDGEHIWANEVKVSGGKVSATINNEPRNIPGVKFGQRVTVPVDRITDWMFMRDGMIHGGQTIRAIIPRLPKEQAEQYRAMLAPE